MKKADGAGPAVPAELQDLRTEIAGAAKPAPAEANERTDDDAALAIAAQWKAGAELLAESAIEYDADLANVFTPDKVAKLGERWGRVGAKYGWTLTGDGAPIPYLDEFLAAWTTVTLAWGAYQVIKAKAEAPAPGKVDSPAASPVAKPAAVPGALAAAS